MELSKRLSAVAALLDNCDKMADIGTDHGYIPIYLVEQKRVHGAIAMDIGKGPLQRAKEHVQLHKLDEYIELRLSDGAKKLAVGEVQEVVIAGMGGRLMMKIIDESQELFHSLQGFVIQPQSEYGFVRHFLEDSGFVILKENMVEEDGKYYPMMRVSSGQMKLEQECFYEYGKYLLTEKHSVLQEYLAKENQNYKKIAQTLQQGTTQKQKERLLEVEQMIKLNEKAAEYFA
jgi:tRNA (adenine22-N1)-methyltransferase